MTYIICRAMMTHAVMVLLLLLLLLFQHPCLLPPSLAPPHPVDEIRPAIIVVDVQIRRLNLQQCDNRRLGERLPRPDRTTFILIARSTNIGQLSVGLMRFTPPYRTYYSGGCAINPEISSAISASLLPRSQRNLLCPTRREGGNKRCFYPSVRRTCSE